MEDPDIIATVLAGDTEAYAELVTRHSPRLLGLCALLLKDRAQAEDAVQEAWIKALRSLASFQGESSFRAWITRIATRLCLDILKSRKRAAAQSWEDLEESGAESNLATQPAPTAQNLLERQESIQKRLEKLPADYREVIVLRELQDLTYEEIARELDCSVDAIKARLKRARAELSARRGKTSEVA